MAEIIITPANSPYTLNLANIGGTSGVGTNQIFVKSRGGSNTLTLGALSGVSGLPQITVVCEDGALAIYTTGTNCAITSATAGTGVSGVSGLVATALANSSLSISNFISAAKSYWLIK